MDNKLVLAVLFVTLSWVSVGTNASNTTTVSPSNMTTASGGNMTTASGGNMTTAMGGNMTTAMGGNGTTAMGGNGTTAMGGNMTTAMGGNMTTAMGGNGTTAMGGNMTTAMGGNMTTAMGGNMTTAMGGNGTTAMGGNGTTAMGGNGTAAMGGNMTTAMGGNGTTAMGSSTETNVTTVAALTPNTTVEVLSTEINNTDCGTKQLCAAQPASCNPTNAGSCFFLAAKRRGGQNFDFGLSGESDGYIAATLSSDSSLGGNDTTYVCANNNGVVKFISTVLRNNELIPKEMNVNSVKGRVNGKRIQCTFAATVPSPTTRTSTFTLAISTGPFNSTSGALGTPTTQLKSDPVDLGNPNATITNQIAANTTSAPATTASSSSVALKQSLTQALLITVGMLGLAML